MYRSTQVDHALRQLRADLLNGEFSQGTRLREITLAERYGCSRHAVREAFGVLEAEGLVKNDPFCGRSVAEYAARELQSIYLMRLSLEPTAAALAAYRITPDQGDELLATARLLHSRPSSYSEQIEWDAEIHRAIWKIADEPALTSQLERLIWPFLIAGTRPGATARDAKLLYDQQIQRESIGHASSHEPLLQAIRSRDPAGARNAMTAHLLASEALRFSKALTDAVAAVFPMELAVRG